MWSFTLFTMFQDWDTRRMIGRVKEKDGLYHLEEECSQSGIKNKLPLSFFFSQSSISNKDKIWIYYFCLGHPHFGILKIMFPLLFKGIDVENFHCGVCELTKHRRAYFPISNKRTSIIFSLIHSGMWGPSTIPNIIGARWFVSFIYNCT